jgi:hypothetical protein
MSPYPSFQITGMDASSPLEPVRNTVMSLSKPFAGSFVAIRVSPPVRGVVTPVMAVMAVEIMAEVVSVEPVGLVEIYVDAVMMPIEPCPRK